MQRNRVEQIRDRLAEIGFRVTRSSNPDWYEAVVVSMLYGPPSTQDQIEQRARDVIMVLGLGGVTYPTSGNHPCFHLGVNGAPDYYLRKVQIPRVGNYTLDDFGVYCATHNRGWRLCETPGDECRPSCRYGMRMP